MHEHVKNCARHCNKGGFAMEKSNTHHILYCRRNWSKGYAAKLRSHPYAKVELDKNVHESIHHFIFNVPVPSEDDCRLAYEVLNAELALGLIHIDDPAEDKILFFLCQFVFNKETREALNKQLLAVRGYGYTLM